MSTPLHTSATTPHKVPAHSVLRRGVLVLVVGAILASGALLTLSACQGEKRLVEQFDIGPPGGPRGPSEGYIWVGRDDLPSPGKSWRTVDPASLTDAQRARIGTFP
jgi:hypothetical protein